MADSRLPTEVELVYEVMPCNAMRTAQEPLGPKHPCVYFREWGTYHSFDYSEEGPPPTPDFVQQSKYVGRAALLPEVLSGCRKTPIMSIGINPNLPGWWKGKRNSINPMFDDYKQFAHYFRYRAVSKLEIPEESYEQFGGGSQDTPYSDFELEVPIDQEGNRTIPVKLQPQKMYTGYEGLLDELAEKMEWGDHNLAIGEDLSYGNMVACPSAKWTTKELGGDPPIPAMTTEQRSGIVSECFRSRKFFLRQLFQTLPRILLCFSWSTANALIGELQHLFIMGNPQPGESLTELMKREIRLQYGQLPDGESLEARVIFSPHITGSSDKFKEARARVMTQLCEEVQKGQLVFNPQTRHLLRSPGACMFCPMLEIGACKYESELQPLSDQPRLTADMPVTAILEEKAVQRRLLEEALTKARSIDDVWADTDEEEGEE